MNKGYFSIAFFLFIFAVSSFASQINRISLSELHSKSDLVVMAQVTEVVKEANQDHVTIQVDSYLKGSNPQKIYTLTLKTRGGLKDFDPSLKKGDTGVFFLKLKEKKGQVEKAYWGSVAIFQKNHFYLTEEKTQTPASIMTSNVHPGHSDKQWVLFENDVYKFVRAGLKHAGKQSQGLFVFSKTQSKWFKIVSITTKDAVFGRSPTFEECKKANIAPPSIGWDFRPLKQEDYVSLPLRYDSFVAFPDSIAYDNKTGLWILSFMSNWNIEESKTVLKFRHSDLETAFSTGSVSAKTSKESDLSAVSDLSTYLDIWRSYRVKRKQVQNIDEYERGFRKGFTSQPGLADGSADFNLGHSDGMLSKMKMFPDRKDTGDSN
jgi:hypothetical protein